jgi:predicted DNA-binding transcriptional regulator AlpA
MKLLDHEALAEIGIADNWTTLNRRIAKEGFPPGRIIGRRRFWTEMEVERWIESRPSAKLPADKGWAKANQKSADSEAA